MNNKEKFLKLKDVFLKEKGKYENLLKTKETKLQEVESTKALQLSLDQARELLLDTAKYQRKKIISDLENMVTKALQYIRNEEIYFIIDMRPVRGRVECDFKIKTVRDGVVNINSVINNRGDGVSDIVSLALSVAMLELSNSDGPIIFDEPAKQVSKKYIENVEQFLKDISIAFDRQIILITHKDELMFVGDNKIDVSLKGTKTFAISSAIS